MGLWVRVKYSSRRATVRVDVKISFGIALEMLWVVEKLLVFSPCRVEYPCESQRSYLPGKKHTWR